MQKINRLQKLEQGASAKDGILVAVYGLHGDFWTVDGAQHTEGEIDALGADYADVVKFRIVREGDKDAEK